MTGGNGQMSMSAREFFAPQTKDYDQVVHQWMPYLMYFHVPHFVSKSVNTDSYGFRVTYQGAKEVRDFKGIDDHPVALLVGGSYAFGVGATHDKNTLPSLMNNDSQYLWLNFGGRAFSSTQEFILFQLFHQKVKNIKKIVIISGINNLALHYLSRYRMEVGPCFFQNQFMGALNISFLPGKRRLARSFLYPLFGEKLDYARFSAGDLARILLGSKQPETSLSINDEDKEYLLQILQRDILNWKIFADSLGIELAYVLAPFENWIKKERSQEEEKLFAELDANLSPALRSVEDRFDMELYRWFMNNLKEICHGNSIKFLDMNAELSAASLDRQWLFIDRGHGTDEGYRKVANILKERLQG